MIPGIFIWAIFAIGMLGNFINFSHIGDRYRLSADVVASNRHNGQLDIFIFVYNSFEFFSVHITFKRMVNIIKFGLGNDAIFCNCISIPNVSFGGVEMDIIN